MMSRFINASLDILMRMLNSILNYILKPILFVSILWV